MAGETQCWWSDTELCGQCGNAVNSAIPGRLSARPVDRSHPRREDVEVQACNAEGQTGRGTDLRGSTIQYRVSGGEQIQDKRGRLM